MFAFASTQGREASFGAAHFLLDPFATAYHRTGFDQATYIYPSRLVSAEEEDLLRFMGRVLDEMPAIRDVLRVAIGLRTGTGRADADELLARAELLRQINNIIARRHLTQVQAAELLGTNQSTVSDLKRGRLSKFSLERLISFLKALDRDVEIVVKRKPRSRKRARLRVATG